MEVESINFSNTGASLQDLLSRVQEKKAIYLSHCALDMRKCMRESCK